MRKHTELTTREVTRMGCKPKGGCGGAKKDDKKKDEKKKGCCGK